MENLHNFSNIVFDLDNTLFDQYHYDKIIFIQYFSHQGLKKAIADKYGESLAKKKSEAQYGYSGTFDDFFHAMKINLPVESLINFYHSPPVTKIQLPEFSKKLLLSLSCKNLILVSNGYFRIQYNKIISLGIGQFFNHIYILSPEGSVNMKPSNEILDHMNLENGPTIYVGDNLELDKNFALNCNFAFYHLDIRNIRST